MPRPALPDRVVGVYPDGTGARVVFIVDGKRGARRYPSLAKAEEAARALTRELSTEGALVSGLVEEWARGLESAPRSQGTVVRHLRYLLGPIWDWPLSRLTARALESQAEAQRPRYSVATLRVLTARAKEWTAWLAKRRLTRTDLGAALVVPRGEARGKPQLRLDEGRRLLAALLADPRPLAAALACCLLLGLRRGEVLALTARDLDQGGAVLVIERGKTRNATRRLQVPEVLRPRLAALAASSPPGVPLFALSVCALGRGLDRHLAALGLPHVCVHSLRGLHATAAREAGATAHLVAAQLGHAGTATQERHYVAPGTGEIVAHRTALRVLVGGK